MSILPWLWERLPRVRLWTIHDEMSSSYQNLPFCLLPRCTASFMAFPSLLYREVWPGMPYQVWPELQPAELGKQDVCHRQAWPIKLCQGHCSFSAFSPVVKGREWITMALEGMIWHGLGPSSVDLTLELSSTVPVNAQGPSCFPGQQWRSAVTVPSGAFSMDDLISLVKLNLRSLDLFSLTPRMSWYYP